MVGYNQPLGLPKGSVRAILALLCVGGGMISMYINAITFEQFIVLSSTVLAFYFGTKKEPETTAKVELTTEEKETICND